VLHALFHFGGTAILIGNIFLGQPVNRGNSDTTLLLTVNYPNKGKRMFAQLAEGAKVDILFEKHFWGA